MAIFVRVRVQHSQFHGIVIVVIVQIPRVSVAFKSGYFRFGSASIRTRLFSLLIVAGPLALVAICNLVLSAMGRCSHLQMLSYRILVTPSSLVLNKKTVATYKIHV